jgi:hypothetical protein
MGQEASTQLREELDKMLVGDNCTAKQYEEMLTRYNRALVAEWDANGMFEHMYAGAGSLE